MKTKILITILSVLSLNSFAKGQSGIYMNTSDYQSNKLTHESECVKIHVHDFFWNMPGINVVADGKKYAYKKSELYGYRDCRNEVYRFYNNTEYRIEEAGNIYVYVQERNIARSKGYIVVNEYYFSVAADGKILPLTLANLKEVYKGNSQFCDLLDQFFSNGDVRAYDKEHKTFKVNYVYSKTIK